MSFLTSQAKILSKKVVSLLFIRGIGVKKNSFTKKERLNSHNAIADLFKNGRAVYSKNMKLIWVEQKESDVQLRILISVPKKKIPKAVNRNFIKRRIKESYRVNKSEYFLKLPKNKQFDIAIIYNTAEKMVFDDIYAEMTVLFKKLLKVVGIK